MKMHCYLLLVLFFVNTCHCKLNTFSHEWELFKLKHGKMYNAEEEETRRQIIFLKHLQEIDEHNMKYDKGEVSFKMCLNHMSDLENEEYLALLKDSDTTSNEARPNASTFVPPLNFKPPFEIDWRKRGAVTEIKDQGNCGSCWAFSAIGAIEGQHFRKTGTLVSFSEQYLIDCSTENDNTGCSGGYPDSAFRFLMDYGGLDSEASYPYTGEQGVCHRNPQYTEGSVTGFVAIDSDNERQLKLAVAAHGPVSVAMQASHHSFKHYCTGVYYEPQCNSEYVLDHAMVAVGYGFDEVHGKAYWLLKNSWGTSWGEQGYIRVARNHGNHCGIATEATYPLV